MDRARQKKIRNIRVIMTNIFMSVSVIAIVFVLMLIAMGFSFNESGHLEQSGLLQLVSNPSGASVKIDGEPQFGHTEFSKMLNSNSHKVEITRKGYDSWSDDVTIDAGLLTRVDWVRLFPTKPEIANAKSFKEIRLAQFSPNRKSLLLIESGSSMLQRIDIQSEKAETKQFDLAKIIGASAEDYRDGIIAIAGWSENNNKLLLSFKSHEKPSWYVIDLEHSDRSINITKALNRNFSDALVANDNITRLWALEDGKLFFVNLDDNKVSEPIADKVATIANNRNNVFFINTEIIVQADGEGDAKSGETTERHLNSYKEGEDSYVSIATLKSNDNLLIAGTYWNEEWLAYSDGSKLTILGGKYPSYGKDSNNALEAKFKAKLKDAPTHISAGGNNHVVVFYGAKEITSYDIETKRDYTTKLDNEISDIRWLDDYLLWQNLEYKLVIRDFNGSNRRTIADNVNADLPAAISENNRWLYYFELPAVAEDSSEASEGAAEGDKTAAGDNELEHPVTITLKREKLQ